MFEVDKLVIFVIEATTDDEEALDTLYLLPSTYNSIELEVPSKLDPENVTSYKFVAVLKSAEKLVRLGRLSVQVNSHTAAVQSASS